jgi:hypothetical protein
MNVASGHETIKKVDRGKGTIRNVSRYLADMGLLGVSVMDTGPLGM